ncbi:MAG: VWA domain-containing protein [bacterium]
MRRRPPILLIAALAMPAVLLGADPDAAYSVQVTQVVVDVTVLDKDGHPIHGLRKDDFELYDDGEKQTLADVTEEGQGGDGAAPASPTTPAGTPAAPATRPPALPAGRMFLLVFDSMHTNASGLARAKEAARTMVKQALGPGDRMAIIRFTGAVTVVQGFTADRDRLLGVLAPVKEPVKGIEPMPEAETPVPPELAKDRRFYQVLSALGRGLASLPGRKYLVSFSGNLGSLFLPVETEEGPTGGVERAGLGKAIDARKSYEETIDELNAANVAVVTVDPGGAGQSPNIMTSEAGADPATEQRESRETHATLARATGGQAIWGSTDLGGRLRDLGESTRSFYLLAYEPSSAQRPGALRKIEVKVKRDGARVLARRGVRAPEPFASLSRSEKKQRIDDALMSWMDLDGIEIHLEVKVGREKKSGDLVLLTHAQVPPSSAALGHGVYVLGFLARQGARGDTRREATFPPHSGEALRYDDTFDVKSGVYTYKIVVRDEVTGIIGTSSVMVTVP